MGEELFGRLRAQFFFEELSYSGAKYPAGAVVEFEFGDSVLLLGGGLVLIQMKEREADAVRDASPEKESLDKKV